jgi:hypothetical protein
MKRILLLIAIICLPLMASAQIVEAVKWSGEVIPATAAGAVDSVRLTATIQEGWHMTLINVGEEEIGEEIYDSPFTFGGVDLYDFIPHPRIQRPISAPVEVDGVSMPSQPGETYVSAQYQPMEVTVTGNDERILLVSTFDNLGKGASGAAIQNMNIRLGLDETTGLKL